MNDFDIKIVEMEIDDFLLRFNNISKEKDKIMVSYSGGSDSDIIMSLFKHHNLLDKIIFVFFDTGIEFMATKKHIDQKIAEGYNIIKIRAYKPVTLCAKQYGQPFISKYTSEMLERLQKFNFNFKDHGNFEYLDLIKIYPKCLSAIRWWSNYYGSKYDINIKNQTDYKRADKSSFNIARKKYLKEFLIEYGLNFRVSNKCCYYAKKKTSKDFEKDFKPDVLITGIRKAEGGVRARAHKACFVPKETASVWMPIIWWKDDFIKNYKEYKNLKLSDCYEVYNLKRTGCAGCPFGKDLQKERQILRDHEPNLSKGIENIFKDTYYWTEKFEEFRSKQVTIKK